MNPIISIIVPCYNQAQYLSEALESVLAQTIENWECVIVNDGSTDNTLEIANEWAQKDSRFTVIDKKNGGPSDARNVGIRASQGKYILPLDADDIVRPQYAELATDYLDCNGDCKIVYSEAELFGGKTGEWVLPEYSPNSELWDNSIFCTAVFRRSDFDKTSGYNLNMKYGNEDWDFWLTLLEEGGEVYKISESMLLYRQHGVSHTTELSENINDALNQMVLNHLDMYKPYLYRLFCNKNIYDQLESLKQLNQELKNSNSYKVGLMILTPLWYVRNVFEKVVRFFKSINERMVSKIE